MVSQKIYQDFQPWMLLVHAIVTIAGMLGAGVAFPYIWLYAVNFHFDFSFVAFVELGLHLVATIVGVAFFSLIPKGVRAFCHSFRLVMRTEQATYKAGAWLFLPAFLCVALILVGFISSSLEISLSTGYERLATPAAWAGLISSGIGAMLLFKKAG